MPTESPTANAELICLARESRGYTQSALAREMSVTQGTLSKVENGQAPASDELLDKLSARLRYPKEFFFERSTIRNLPLAFWRKRIRVSAVITRQLRARLNIIRQHIIKLLRSVEVPENRVPLVQDADPEKLAQELRIRWHLPRGPIQNLTQVVEAAGVLIVRSEFGTDRIDAISLFEPEDEIPPLILINDSIPGDRYRYTLAHELGHICMHHHLSLPDEDVETEANGFASELLMPAKEIRGFLNRPTIASLANLKPYWRVSMQAMLMRAGQLRLINERQKSYLWSQISASGYRMSEPFPLAPEEPSLIKGLIDCHLTELGYSESALSRLLHLELAEFRSYYKPSASSPLRLVK